MISTTATANAPERVKKSARTETGHAKNVLNFEKLITYASSLGESYNPNKKDLKIEALNRCLNEARASLNNIYALDSAYKNAVNARKVAFMPFSKLVTRIINALKASDSTKQTDDSAITLVRKIQGRRAKPKKSMDEKTLAAANGKEIVEHSSSQMSYDSQISNFEKLITLLSTIPEYSPLEGDLTLPALNELCTNLRKLNLDVITANHALANARILRNKALYKPNTGLIDIALDVKLYIKSVFGGTSPQYKIVAGTKFSTSSNR